MAVREKYLMHIKDSHNHWSQQTLSVNAYPSTGPRLFESSDIIEPSHFENSLFLQARNYIQSLTQMPKMNFANVFIGANPLGKLTVSSSPGY